MFSLTAKVHAFKYTKAKTITLLITTEIKGFFPKHTIPCVQKIILLLECILQSRSVCLCKYRDKVAQLHKRKKQIYTTAMLN